eukprot:gene7871-9707_t
MGSGAMIARVPAEAAEAPPASDAPTPLGVPRRALRAMASAEPTAKRARRGPAAAFDPPFTKEQLQQGG